MVFLSTFQFPAQTTLATQPGVWSQLWLARTPHVQVQALRSHSPRSVNVKAALRVWRTHPSPASGGRDVSTQLARRLFDYL